MAAFISEDDMEQALLQRLQHLAGWSTLNCFTAQPEDLNDGSGRADKREVILADIKDQEHATGNVTTTAAGA